MPIAGDVHRPFQPFHDPLVTGVHRVLEPVGHDPFIDDLPRLVHPTEPVGAPPHRSIHREDKMNPQLQQALAHASTGHLLESAAGGRGLRSCDRTEPDARARRTRPSYRTAARLALVLAVLVAWAAVLGVPSAQAAQVEDWRITSAKAEGTEVAPGVRRYRLQNRTIGRTLRYGERTFGINLVWAGNGITPNVRFERLSGSGPLRYNESVAIHVQGGGYLRYKRRAFGINLSWSSRPVYHWRLRGGTGVIRTGDSLSIYNKAANDVVVYGKRSVGINLRWYRDTLEDDSDATTADASLAVRVGPFPTSGGGCSGRVVWRLTPLRLRGTDGIGRAVSVDRVFREPAVFGGHDENGRPQYFCEFDSRTGNLRTGTWRVQASTPVGWSASCEVDLAAGSNVVHFRQHHAGCVESPFGWPGDPA